MEHLDLEIRFEEDDTRATPGRLTGVLMTYEQRAKDRPELFSRGALYWPDDGIVINESHNRKAPILRTLPTIDGDVIRINAALPNTTRGRDAAEGVRERVYGGLSVEFRSDKETFRGGLRIVQKAFVPRAGLVDSPAYGDSIVELRERRYWHIDTEALRWL